MPIQLADPELLWWDRQFSDPVVISTRVRIARNLPGIPFPWRAEPHELNRVSTIVTNRLASLETSAWEFNRKANTDHSKLVRLRYAKLWPYSDSDPDFQSVLCMAGFDRPAIIANDEDHIRVIKMVTGWHPAECYNEANSQIDDLNLQFAMSEPWGYLTASPQNSGHGIRISALLHVIGLHMTGRLDSVIKSLNDVNISVRGSTGESGGHIGHVIQVSNRWRHKDRVLDAIARVESAVSILREWEMDERLTSDSWTVPVVDAIFLDSVSRMRSYLNRDPEQQNVSSKRLLQSTQRV